MYELIDASRPLTALSLRKTSRLEVAIEHTSPEAVIARCDELLAARLVSPSNKPGALARDNIASMCVPAPMAQTLFAFLMPLEGP